MEHGEGQAHFLPLVRTSVHPQTLGRAPPEGRGGWDEACWASASPPGDWQGGPVFPARGRKSIFLIPKVPGAGDEWLRTLFLKWLFREAVHTSSSMLYRPPPSAPRGLRATWLPGDRPPRLQLGMPRPLPLSVGRRQDSFSSLETKPGGLRAQ